MSIVNYTITNNGLNLLGSGDDFSFYRIILGEGNHTAGEDLTNALYITGNPKSFDIAGVTRSNNVITITGVITNAAFTSAYHLTEIGLTAKQGDHTYLVAVGVLDYPANIPAHSSDTEDVTIDVTINIAISRA